jgi:hypothetical protein
MLKIKKTMHFPSPEGEGAQRADEVVLISGPG